MAGKKSILLNLIRGHFRFIATFFGISILLILSSILLYNGDFHEFLGLNGKAQEKFADFLMTLAEAILGAGLIIGGINLLLEEFKQEREEKDRSLQYRHEMLDALQSVHNEVQLARVLIRSHKSAKTYGEQMRSRILPSIIALKDLRRSAMDVHNHPLEDAKVPIFRVSLNYMIAYLSVLIEEFEENYLHFSNLQNLQEALTLRIRNIFVQIAESNTEDGVIFNDKSKFLEQAEEIFEQMKKPDQINEVWKKIEQLQHTCDFISETSNEKSEYSKYYDFFIVHYIHCKKILKFNQINHSLIERANFPNYLSVLNQNDKKEKSNLPSNTRVSLTKEIMVKELGFVFQNNKSFDDLERAES